MIVFKTILSGTILLLLVLIAGPYTAVHFRYLFDPLPIGALRWLGLPLIIVGAPCAFWCAYLVIVPGKGHPSPYDSPSEFVITGPYKYVRNPFMLGSLVALWGEVLVFKSVVLLICALILSWCTHFWVVFYEEPSLEERYGEEYKKYKASVPRWIPRPKSKP